MSWKELLTREMDYNYAVTEKLFDLVKDGHLWGM